MSINMNMQTTHKMNNFSKNSVTFRVNGNLQYVRAVYYTH